MVVICLVQMLISDQHNHMTRNMAIRIIWPKTTQMSFSSMVKPEEPIIYAWKGDEPHYFKSRLGQQLTLAFYS